MNLDNVVLVRAMSHLPLDGELIPSCEGQRLVNDQQSEFYYFIRRCVQTNLENEIGRSLDFFSPESHDEELMNNMMNNYLVLTGDYYTTTLSFSLNGLVPDDMNNNFSNMKLAILEPLRNQTEADFVNIETIDTTVKGRMQLSDEAMLVIDKEIFASLSEEEQINLSDNFKIRLFEGELRDAVNNTLRDNGYPVLPLIQKREIKNIDECPERESMLLFEDRFAESVGASRLRLQDLTITYGGGTKIDENAHNKIAEEHPNTLMVQEYYKNQLYSFMLNKTESFGISVTDEEKFYLFTDYDPGIDAMQRITTELITSYGGIENFQVFIQDYNQHVRDNYLTNQQIISLANNKTIN